MISFPIPELCVSEDTVYRSSASKNEYKVKYVLLCYTTNTSYSRCFVMRGSTYTGHLSFMILGTLSSLKYGCIKESELCSFLVKLPTS